MGRKETEGIVEPYNKENLREEDTPSFDQDLIANHILTGIDDINSWKGFIFRRNEKGERHIVSNNKRFHLHLFNQERANNLVTTLNNIVRGSEISVDITNHIIFAEQKRIKLVNLKTSLTALFMV